MTERENLLDRLWSEIIASAFADAGLDNIVTNSRRDPDGPFGDTGAAIERLLASGASRRDLRLLMRAISYEAVFGTLAALEDAEAIVPDGDFSGLHEDLLSADPSGLEGRPGSAGR